MKRLVILSMSLVLFSSLVALTCAADDTDAKDKGARDMKTVTGKVTQIDDRSLTVEVTSTSGSPESVVIMISPDTQKPSDLAIGSNATVQYKENAGQKVAVRIVAPSAGAPK